MAGPFGLSSVTVGVQLHFFVGFRENIIARHNIPDNTAWLLRRLPPRDASPPLVVLPLRQTRSQFDPFLADVVALEMGDGYARSSYKPAAGLDDELNPYNFSLASRPDHVFRSGVVCATPTTMRLNSVRYEPVPIDKLCSPLEQWLVLASQTGGPLLLTADIADDPAHPLNSLSWRPMEATSPMLDIHSLFVPCSPSTATSVAWFRDTVARIRSSCLLHISPSCRPSFQIEFGRHKEDADEVGTLLALKRLATMLLVGGEDCLRRAFVAPARKSELVMLTESCSMRVRPWNRVSKLVAGHTLVLNPDAGTRAPPTRKRCYQNNRLDLGNIRFYLDNVAHFNGPPPQKAALKARLEARAAAEEVLQSSGSSSSSLSSPRRVCYKDSARIAEYGRRGLAMDRVLADDIYMIWRCHTPDLLARLLAPHYIEDPSSYSSQPSSSLSSSPSPTPTHLKPIFDFGAWRGKERHKLKALASTFPLAVSVNLFAATMDPELLQAQLRVVCGLANRAVYGDVGPGIGDWPISVYTFGRAHVESPVYPVVSANPVPVPVSNSDKTDIASLGNLDLGIFAGTYTELDSFGLDGYIDVPGIDLGAVDTVADAFADDALLGMLEAGSLPGFTDLPGFPDCSLNQTDQVDTLPQPLLDAIDAAADNTVQDPEEIPYDSWSGPAAAATGYLVWLGLVGDDITRLDDYTNNGMQSAEDVPDDDGVLRSFER